MGSQRPRMPAGKCQQVALALELQCIHVSQVAAGNRPVLPVLLFLSPEELLELRDLEVLLLDELLLLELLSERFLSFFFFLFFFESFLDFLRSFFLFFFDTLERPPGLTANRCKSRTASSA